MSFLILYYQDLYKEGASLVTQMVKNLSAMQETQGSTPGSESSPGEWNDSHSSIFAWRIPWTEDTGRVIIHGITKSRTWQLSLTEGHISKLIDLNSVLVSVGFLFFIV